MLHIQNVHKMLDVISENQESSSHSIRMLRGMITYQQQGFQLLLEIPKNLRISKISFK